MNRRQAIALAGTALAVALLPFGAAVAQEQQGLVDKARITLQGFLADPQMGYMRQHLPMAKGVFVVPQLLKAGFIIGGSGGSGVLLARDPSTAAWSDPAFFTMGAGSIGLQIGAEASEVVLVVMTQRGVDAILANNLKLGADASISAGPVGAGVGAATTANLGTDIYTFARSKGLYGGISLEGAVIAYRDDWNSAYYGKPVSATDIVVRREVRNDGASDLKAILQQATTR